MSLRWLLPPIAGAIAAIAVALIPMGGLSYSGRGALALLVFAIGIWTSETIPLPVSSLLILLIQPIFGIVSFEQALRGFANPILFLLLGGFMIAEGVTHSGLDDRVTYNVMSRFGKSAGTILFGVIFLTGILSAWINNLVAFAMALPVVKRIITLEQERYHAGGNFAKRLVLGASYGSLAGGLSTEIGTGPNLIAAAYTKFPFEKWLIFGIPLALILMLVVWKILTTTFPVQLRDDAPGKPVKRPTMEKPGRLNKNESSALVILLAVIALLMTAPITGIDGYAVTLIGAVLLFLTGTISWKNIQKDIDWGTIVFFGAALSLGNALLVSGAANWVIESMMNGIGGSVNPLLIVLILMVAGAALTQVLSNIGLAAILVPIATTLAGRMNLGPGTFVIPVALACSLSFMFPMSDPTIAMAHGTSHVRSKDIIKAGLPTTITSTIVTILVILALLRFVT